ncbi:MAG: sugar phosphate nucleotidyltransferase [Planctomycetota bacterium]
MKAVVLAAGYATRLGALGDSGAKALLEVGGRPVLDHLVDRLRPLAGLAELVLVTNDRFHADFVRWAGARDRPFPVRLVNDGTRANAERRGGIADLALAVAEALRDGPTDLLVAAGDNLLGFDLAEFAAAFGRLGRPLVLARRLPDAVPPRRHGEIVAGADGRILSFREKPDDPRSPLAAACVYAFPAAVREHLAAYLAAGGDRDAPGHFLAWLVARTPVHVHVAPAPIHDIGDPASLAAARQAFGAPIRTRPLE